VLSAVDPTVNTRYQAKGLRLQEEKKRLDGELGRATHRTSPSAKGDAARDRKERDEAKQALEAEQRKTKALTREKANVTIELTARQEELRRWVDTKTRSADFQTNAVVAEESRRRVAAEKARATAQLELNQAFTKQDRLERRLGVAREWGQEQQKLVEEAQQHAQRVVEDCHIRLKQQQAELARLRTAVGRYVLLHICNRFGIPAVNSLITKITPKSLLQSPLLILKYMPLRSYIYTGPARSQRATPCAAPCRSERRPLNPL